MLQNLYCLHSETISIPFLETLVYPTYFWSKCTLPWKQRSDYSNSCQPYIQFIFDGGKDQISEWIDIEYLTYTSNLPNYLHDAFFWSPLNDSALVRQPAFQSIFWRSHSNPLQDWHFFRRVKSKGKAFLRACKRLREKIKKRWCATRFIRPKNSQPGFFGR